MTSTLLILTLLSVGLCAPTEEEVLKLKGYIDFSTKFKMYSGYLEVQAHPEIKVYYLFVTSQDKP